MVAMHEGCTSGKPYRTQQNPHIAWNVHVINGPGDRVTRLYVYVTPFGHVSANWWFEVGTRKL